MTPRLFPLSLGLVLACVIVATSARAAGPSADYQIQDEYTQKSPDGQTIIEQKRSIARARIFSALCR